MRRNRISARPGGRAMFDFGQLDDRSEEPQLNAEVSIEM